ncbi:MAG: hypothetical protein ACJ779_06540, partial [Chloroflexota bacterium]
VVGMFLAVPVLGVISASWRAVLQVLGDRPPAPEIAIDTDTAPLVSDPIRPGPQPEPIIPSG